MTESWGTTRENSIVGIFLHKYFFTLIDTNEQKYVNFILWIKLQQKATRYIILLTVQSM